jgi:hypothetical protein
VSSITPIIPPSSPIANLHAALNQQILVSLVIDVCSVPRRNAMDRSTQDFVPRKTYELQESGVATAVDEFGGLVENRCWTRIHESLQKFVTDIHIDSTGGNLRGTFAVFWLFLGFIMWGLNVCPSIGHVDMNCIKL